jgi:hypothetical protein
MKNHRWFWLCAMIVPLAGLVVCFWWLSKARARAEAFTRENNPPIVFMESLRMRAAKFWGIPLLILAFIFLASWKIPPKQTASFQIPMAYSQFQDTLERVWNSSLKKQVMFYRQQTWSASIPTCGRKNGERIRIQIIQLSSKCSNCKT